MEANKNERLKFEFVIPKELKSNANKHKIAPE
jgi:hypothetical protein